MTNVSHEKLLESLFEGVYYVDLRKRITYWNTAAERITGFSRAEVLGSCCADNILRHVDDAGRELCRLGCPLAATLLDGKMREANVFLHHKQGHRVPVSIRIAPVRDESGIIVGGVEVFSDNSHYMQIIKDLEDLRQEVYLDGLTKVSNRRYGEMILQTRLYEWQTYQVSFGVIFLDLDDFKNLNDSYGHQVGDRTLVMVSKTIVNAVRRLDVVARWGGEEFIIILSNMTSEALQEIAERVRILIEQSFIMLGEDRLTATASVGATLVQPENTTERIVRRADSLMYISKTTGRNRVTYG